MENQIKIIDVKALKYNLEYIKSKLTQNTKLCIVLKDNAYGHGIKNILPIVEKYANYYAVANINEAIELRQLTNVPILTLCECPTEKLHSITQHNIDITISSIQTLQSIIKLTCQNINVHIAIDTGMHRLGFNNLKDFKLALKLILKHKNIHLIGIYSHIGDAHNNKRLSLQNAIFNKYYALVKHLPIIAHIANSDTMHSNNTMQYNMVRVGINIYGYGNKNLLPVMAGDAKITHIKIINKNDYIGYGSQHNIKPHTKIAIINIGYGQGYLRSNEKFGYVIINNKLCKIVANVCMDMIMVDASNVKCKVGDYAVILGKQGNHNIDANLLATFNSTIPYEILTNFNLIKNSTAVNGTE